MKNIPIEKRTGVVVPLGALYSQSHTVIGEFPSLAELIPFCRKAGLSVIQLLPVNDTGTQSSPYSGLSAFALHPIYISLADLPEFPSLYKTDAAFAEKYDKFIQDCPYSNRYRYDAVLSAKTSLLRAVFDSTESAAEGTASKELSSWIADNPWIESYAVYKNLKWKYMQATWKAWKPEDCSLSHDEIHARWTAKKEKKDHLFHAWTQMRAAQQFAAAADKVRKAGIILKGDMPILMNDDSCDAWAEPAIFNQSLRAGAPVDGENPAGQNWGFPVYNWKYLKSQNYAWWKDRLASAAHYYGAYRLDHILGFFRIWAVPSRDTTAILGHTEPYKAITRRELNDAGFDDGRIRWMSQPHVPTGLIEDITWNHDIAHKILETCMTQLPGEELWLFRQEISGDKDIYDLDFSSLVNEDASNRIKKALAGKWLDRSFIEIEKDAFVPLWTYTVSTAWNTLSGDEKNRLQNMIGTEHAEEEKLWEQQASDILKALTSSVNMVPCGEDLGVNLACLPPVMKANNILSLRVVRWAREWSQNGQPYVPFASYPLLSVTTTSVHDSPTIRQWWEEDRGAADLFARTYSQDFAGIDAGRFTPETAERILSAAAESGSAWCIHPLQDYLYMNKAYWLEKSCDERVNVPGSVSEFNWTYRLPASLETLEKDTALIHKIKQVAQKHDGGKN
jgi:4-alpha-glucanotransferase